jgi:hypothetical protein
MKMADLLLTECSLFMCSTTSSDKQINQKNKVHFLFTLFLLRKKNKSLEEIVDELQQGNMSWINKISYFGENAKEGSPTFWRATSWIHHHINIGNGPPSTFFITLSCAEYWWPDIERLKQTDLFKWHCCWHHLTSLPPKKFQSLRTTTLL